MNTRPEDRHGIEQGTLLSCANVAFYRAFARQWRKLPNLRGKVRIAMEIYKLLGLENHHIFETATIENPIQYKAILDLHSWLERLAFLMNGYESETVRFLARCYTDDGYFLDIGANIGLISLPFSNLVARRGDVAPDVFCIEAVQANLDRLRENVNLNRKEETITPIGKAVGERQKFVEIQVEGNLRDGAGTGTANILADGTDHPCERIPLEITTINKLMDSGELPQDCSLVKIDADGYDLKILEGATDLLATSRPVIFGEFMRHCLAWHGQTHEDVVAFVGQFDYRVFSKDESVWQFLPWDKNPVESDLLIVPEEKIVDLNWCLNG